MFAYANNYLHKQNQGKFYENFGVRKFGWWIEDVKKKPHQELSELMGAGASEKIMKTFNRIDIPMTLFIIFTPGGIDFVGGYSYYRFLTNNLFNQPISSLENVQMKLGKLNLEE